MAPIFAPAELRWGRQFLVVRRHMHTLTKLRRKYEHQKLMALCARFDSWMTIPLVCTMFLFMGVAFADKFEAKVLRAVFMASGFVALSITFFFFVCWAFFRALDGILHTKSRGVWRVFSVGGFSAPFLAVIFVVGYAVYVVIRAVILSR